MLIVLEKVFPTALPFLIASFCILILTSVYTTFFELISDFLTAVKSEDDEGIDQVMGEGNDQHLQDHSVQGACSIPWVRIHDHVHPLAMIPTSYLCVRVCACGRVYVGP